MSHFRPISRLCCLCILLMCSCERSSDDPETAVAKMESERKQTTPSNPSGPGPATAPPAKASVRTTQAARTEIALLLPDLRIPMQVFQRDGLTMLVGRQEGCRLTTHDAAGSATVQADQFRQAITSKPAAIFVSPIDPPSLAALIVEAQTSGITVIGLDKRMLNEGCSTVVFSDQRRVGRMAAETVLAALKRKATEENRPEVTGRVVELRGAENSFFSDEIAEGFAAEIHKESGVILVHDAPADWKGETAAQRLNEAFRLQKQFDVVFAHNDAIALGAAKAATEAGQRDNILIIGTDGLSGQKRGMDLVREGEIDATVVQPALVDLALQITIKLRDDKNFKPQPAYEVEPFAIVPKNVDEVVRSGSYKLPRL
ncbi:MAG: substrate-binding domain-containing protein [Verrucomicrobiaceae bacterium]